MLFEAQLDCVHPLCHRWPKTAKQVRRLVRGENLEEARSNAMKEYSNKRARRCRECHRTISIKHMTLVGINPADGSYLPRTGA